MVGFAKEFSSHDQNDWRSLKNLDPSLQFGDRLKLQLQTFGRSVTELINQSDQTTSSLGLERFASADSLSSLIKLRQHFSTCPEIPAEWLDDQIRIELSNVAKTQEKAASRRSKLLSEIIKFIDWDNTTVDWVAASSSLGGIKEDRELLDQFLGKAWNQEVAADAAYVESRIYRLYQAITDIESDAQQLARHLDLRDPKTLPQVRSLRTLAAQIGSLGEIPKEWIVSVETDELFRLYEEARD